MSDSQGKWELTTTILRQARLVLEVLMNASENLDPTAHSNIEQAKNRLDKSLQNEASLKKAVEQIQDSNYQKLVNQLAAEEKKIPPYILKKLRQRQNFNP